MFAQTTKTKTVFLNQSDANNHYFLSNSQLNQQSFDMFKTLAEATVIINNLILQFALGNFEFVAQNLNMSKYNSLAVLMNSLTQNAFHFPVYEQIRQTVNSTLQGLLQAVNEYMALVNCEEHLKQVQAKANILNDMTLLQEYIDSLKSRRTLFPSTTVTIAAAEIKPEYALYIKSYGYPLNGVFEIDKLAKCIETLYLV